MGYCPNQYKDYKGQIGENENKEVLVVLGTQTVIYKGTVMVVKLHTSVANRAVEGCFRLYNLVKHAEILNVDLLFKEFVYQGDKFETGRQIARSTKGRQ